jgi:hypothetical protein
LATHAEAWFEVIEVLKRFQVPSTLSLQEEHSVSHPIPNTSHSEPQSPSGGACFQQEGNNVKKIKAENGTSQGQNLALTILVVLKWLDRGARNLAALLGLGPEGWYVACLWVP